ncbi:hypothetical protein FAP39_17250 [Shimia litoralis]|uniref:Uncharacterized protein n=1 Tax=Shimia litoralis TaxID=420403 RepID=A0A4U7MR65_9RHOB|nr:hypothetical protein [Shimia litoralis]TKZ15435.1 hypothetical protein FAP39_17250 [Shimia litoralis]
MSEPADPPHLWPFPLRWPLIETQEWRTDVLATKDAEQRIALRTMPRTRLTCVSILEARGLASAAELARGGVFSTWQLPLWHRATPLAAPVDAGDTEVLLNTGGLGFAVGDHAALATGASIAGCSVDIHEIAEVLEDRLVLTLPVSMTAPHASVMPVSKARMQGPVEILRRRQSLGTVTAKFLLAPQADQSATLTSLYPTYQGKNVLMDPAVLRQPLSEAVDNPVDYIDNGFGPIEIEALRSYAQRRSNITLVDRGPARWTSQAWLQSLRGRQNSFWLPSWGRELGLQVPLARGDTSGFFNPAQVSLDPDSLVGRHLMIELPGGALFREVLAASGDALSLQITLAAPGVAVPRDTPIHLMHHMRLDADRIEVMHTPNRMEMSLPLIEVPA